MLPGVHTTSGRSSSDQQQQQLQASRMFRLPSIAPSVAGGRRPKSKQQPNPIQDAGKALLSYCRRSKSDSKIKMVDGEIFKF